MYVWPSSERNHVFSCFFNTMARWSPSSKRNGVKTRNRSSPSRTIRTLAQTFSRNDFSMAAVFMPPPDRRDEDWGRAACQTRNRPPGSGARCQSPQNDLSLRRRHSRAFQVPDTALWPCECGSRKTCSLRSGWCAHGFSRCGGATGKAGCCLRGKPHQDNREVQNVQAVLPRNQPEFDAGGARNGELRFAVAPLLPKLQLLTILIRQQLAFGEQLLDIRICVAGRHDGQRNLEYTATSHSGHARAIIRVRDIEVRRFAQMPANRRNPGVHHTSRQRWYEMPGLPRDAISFPTSALDRCKEGDRI